MRIIAGEWGSRRIAQPPTRRTRPMPDMLREAIFDMLTARIGDAGSLPPIHVADLFAGSGGMGLEALSRGAAYCHFVEKRRAAMKTLQQNVKSLHAESRGDLLRSDAWTACLTTPRPQHSYALIFVDPPFRDARDSGPTGRVRTLWSHLIRAGWATKISHIVTRHEAEVVFEPAPTDFWEVVVHRIYGSSGVTIIRCKQTPTLSQNATAIEPDDPGSPTTENAT
jgi:16S rRNA (guanine966-N2)-methyltransferase